MNSKEDLVIIQKEILDELLHTLWGSDVSPDVFKRWNQGFVFGDDEPTALLQSDGGPCAVIVPVQAYLLKYLMFSASSKESWRQTTGCERDKVLCEALADILCQVAAPASSQFTLCLLSLDSLCGHSDSDVSCTKRQRFSHEEFHSALCIKVLSHQDQLRLELSSHLNLLSGQYGVLLFLYSVLLTKGCRLVKKEMSDASEPLIDCVHGHGSQSLVNLLLTGQATSHVWDNEKNVSGLKLQGISSRSDIGFLTLLEHLRYCEVGWYLKNPKYPIWVLGSETHLTLLFSQEQAIVGDEGQDAMVRRMFSRFDEEGRGFIAAESLGELMSLLDLVSEPEYVKLMAEKLDPEQLGVITFNSFVDEFFPSSARPSDAVQSFTVFHYNGLQRSSPNKVAYVEGRCNIPEMPELQMMTDYSPIKSCLMTKWPTIELTWSNGITPSII